MSDASGSHPAGTDSGPSSTGRLVRDLGFYLIARFALVAVLAVVIVFGAKVVGVDIPLLVALIFAILLSLPLSMVVFKTLRIRVNEDIAAVDERRRRDKADLRAKLRGDGPSERPSGPAE